MPKIITHKKTVKTLLKLLNSYKLEPSVSIHLSLAYHHYSKYSMDLSLNDLKHCIKELKFSAGKDEEILDIIKQLDDVVSNKINIEDFLEIKNTQDTELDFH